MVVRENTRERAHSERERERDEREREAQTATYTTRKYSSTTSKPDLES